MAMCYGSGMFLKFRAALKQRRAYNAFIAARYREALKSFTDLYRQYPNTEGARYNIALCHISLQEYREAEPYLLDELRMYGDDYARLKILGDLYFYWGKRRKAEKSYLQALALDSDGEGSHLLRKRIEQSQDPELFQAAQASLKEYHRGFEALKNRDTDEARDAFTRAVEFDRFNIHALNNLGAIYLNNDGDYQTAIDLFTQALKLQEVQAFRENLEKALNSQKKEKKKERRNDRS